MSPADRLIALLEQSGASDPAVRQVTGSLRRTPQEVAERFDHYQRLVEGVGAQQAVRIVINAAQLAHKGWLA
jgi:hypothetical protein